MSISPRLARGVWLDRGPSPAPNLVPSHPDQLSCCFFGILWLVEWLGVHLTHLRLKTFSGWSKCLCTCQFSGQYPYDSKACLMILPCSNLKSVSLDRSAVVSGQTIRALAMMKDSSIGICLGGELCLCGQLSVGCIGYRYIPS